MRYEEKKDGIGGGLAKARTTAAEIKEERRAVENDGVDLGDRYIPLNIRLDSADYEKNESLIDWKKEESPYTADEVALDNGHGVGEQRIPCRYEVPEQEISDGN